MSSSTDSPSQSKPSFSGAVNKHALTCNFAPFTFVYYEFTVCFTYEVCKYDAHARASSGHPSSLRPA